MKPETIAKNQRDTLKRLFGADCANYREAFIIGHVSSFVRSHAHEHGIIAHFMNTGKMGGEDADVVMALLNSTMSSQLLGEFAVSQPYLTQNESCVLCLKRLSVGFVWVHKKSRAHALRPVCVGCSSRWLYDSLGYETAAQMCAALCNFKTKKVKSS